MKEVKAIFQPFMFESVLQNLQELAGLPGATVSQVDGYSTVHPEQEPKPKIKLEMMIPDDMVDAVVQAIEEGARTGNPGDGRIFVIDVESTVKIRTGERDTAF